MQVRTFFQGLHSFYCSQRLLVLCLLLHTQSLSKPFMLWVVLKWCAWICKHFIELPLLSPLWGVFALLPSIWLQPHYSDGSHLPLPQLCLSSSDDIHSDYFYRTKAIVNSNVMNNISSSSQECLVSPILSPSQGCEHLEEDMRQDLRNSTLPPAAEQFSK